MRYSFAFTGLVTMAFSSVALAQTTAPVETDMEPTMSTAIDMPGTSDVEVPPTSDVVVPPTSSVTADPMPTHAVDPCLEDCNKKHDACNTAPGANHASCASEYSECLGYNPYAGSGFVEPTACSKSMTSVLSSKTMTGMPAPVKTESPEVCCVTCTTAYKACCDAAGGVIDHCKIEYTTCLGYNPFEVVPWAEPTVCKHPDTKPAPPTGGKGGDDSTGGHKGGDDSTTGSKGGDKGMGGKPSGTPEECCVTCTTTYKACCDAAGDVIDHCKVAYTSCLGYNPFEVVPWAEPTVCKHPDDDVVIVSGGESLRPALALLALGAIALL